MEPLLTPSLADALVVLSAIAFVAAVGHAWSAHVGRQATHRRRRRAQVNEARRDSHPREAVLDLPVTIESPQVPDDVRDFFESAMDGLEDAVHTVDGSLRLVAGNEAFRERVLRATGSLPTPGTPVEMLYPAGERAVWVARYRLAIDGKPFAVDHAGRARDGATVVSDVRLSPVTVSGTAAGVLVIARDVTDTRRLTDEVRESETHFRALVEQASDLVLTLAPDGAIQYASPSSARVLGYADDELTGRALLMLTHPDDIEALRTALADLEYHPERTPSLLFRARHKSGGWRALEAACRAHISPRGETTLLMYARNVSERQALEDELRRRQRGGSLARMVSGIAHEYNNLLTAIIGNVMFTRAEGAVNDAGLADAEIAAVRAQALTRLLSAFSGKTNGELVRLHVGERIAELDFLLRRLIGDDVVLSTSTQDLDWQVQLPEAQFEQLIVNLAMAARAAMPEGGQLTIETRTVSLLQALVGHHPQVPPGEYVSVSVVDSGGTPLDALPGTDPDVADARAGLAVADAIVQRASGYLWTYREDGYGTCYRVYLPRHRDQASPRNSPFDRMPPAGEPFIGGADANILLAEDDPAIRSLTARILRQYGYTVIEAIHGADALHVARHFVGPIHLVLADLVMPQMNGVELITQLRAKRSDVRGLLMSGYPAAAAYRAAGAAVEAEFLSKPFSPDELLHAVRCSLDAGREAPPVLVQTAREK
jgi:PAS domain S-box-containing protein